MRDDKEKEMRRLGAAGIDFLITYVFSVIVYCMMISFWKMIRTMRGADMGNYSRLLVVLLFFISYILTNVIYSVFFDSVFRGNTFGKRIVGYKIYVREYKENRNWILKHALLKTGASMVYIITVLYYICTFRMPYDNMCGINSEIGKKESDGTV